MKQYTKPSVNVVELAVKENIANLPVAIGGTVTSTQVDNGTNVILTTYNLAAAQTSNPTQA